MMVARETETWQYAALIGIIIQKSSRSISIISSFLNAIWPTILP